MLLLLSAVMLSCGKDDEIESVDNNNNENNNEKTELKVQFSNPQALLLKKSTLRSSSGENTTTLFQLDDKGNVSPVIEGISINEATPFSGGVVISLYDNGYNIEQYIIYLDNTYWKLPDGFSSKFIGENEDGDLIFADASIVRKGAKKLEKLQTAIDSPRVQSMSGNFVVLEGGHGSIYQILNTANNVRYNIFGCNGPRIVALNKEKALINDCQENALIDMNTGVRSKADIGSWNGEDIYMKNGAIIMSQGLAGTSGYGIGFLDIYGKLTVISGGFNPGSGGYYSDNRVLFVSDNHYIVRELAQISVVKKGESTKKSILTGYNVVKISVKGDNVYFIAEDNLGKKMTGFYSLKTENVFLVISQEEFDEIFAF